MKNWLEWTLPNGIRVVHMHETFSRVAHCCLMVNAGSRDEAPNQQGLAHFIEHAIFKGTQKRKAYHILNRIDSVGGELNAYTSKEETAVYASFGDEHFGRAVEIIADVMFNSVFPEKELEKEKQVIVDEIYSYLDSPSEQIFDDFEEQVFKHHPIGRNILGTEESVNSFSQSDIHQFIEANYSTEEMVFAVVGNVSKQRVNYFLHKYFGAFPNKPRTQERLNFKGNPETSTSQKLEKDTHQAHLMLGGKAFEASHELNASMALVNMMIGGQSMNNRLHMALREKRGIAYHVESNYQPYSDTGLFTIYVGTDKKRIETSKKVIAKEIEKLSTKALGQNQLSMAKTQLKGHVLLGQESRSNAMLSLAKNLLHLGKIETEAEIIHRIDGITQNNVFDVMHEVWDFEKLNELIYF